MRNIKKLLCVLLCVATVLVLVACNQDTKQPQATTHMETLDIVFSAKYLNVVEVEPALMVESLKKTNPGQYTDIFVNEDGTSVTMKLTQAQVESWKTVNVQSLENVKKEFEKIDPSYKVTWTEDFSTADFHYDLDLPAQSALQYVITVEQYCIIGQLLNGVAFDGWKVNFNIYNSGSGKLVTSGDSDVGLGYETSDWEASE